MKGLWKNNISGWNHKDFKRKKIKLKHYRIENGKWFIKNIDVIRLEKNKETRTKFSYSLNEIEDSIYNKRVIGYEYYKLGLNGCSGSKHRGDATNHINAIRRMATRTYIKKENWDKVFDYHGMKKTVDWDIS